MTCEMMSDERIYRYVWANKKYRRGAKTAGRGCIPNRVDIQRHPKIEESKLRTGDWEGVMLSLVD
jgi:IS30 family transposase